MESIDFSCHEYNTQMLPCRTLKILAIGNSFSVDAMEYLWNILRDGGADTVVLGNLYIGGCSLHRHWKNMQQGAPAYTYYKNTDGTWSENPDTSIREALTEENWDVITMQQASGSSGLPDTYEPLKNILAYVKSHKTNPNAKLFWHMTWAYQSDSTHKEFPHYNCNQMTMYRSIGDAVRSVILKSNDFQGLIPVGTAIQNLRASHIGDHLTRDGFHLSFDYGRFTAALTWFAAMGGDLQKIGWVPADDPALVRDIPLIYKAVEDALVSPFAVHRGTTTA